MAFTYIDSNDLTYWSGLTASKADLPLIISRLVRRTTPGLESSLIPIGISTYSGGWDGEIRNSAATEFVPAGLSLWEMGTEKSPAVKAEKDYKKRKENTSADLAAEAIFVFVTTRPWKNKQVWIDKKKADLFFSDVQVIEADKLVEWLSLSPVTIQDLAHHIGRKIDAYVQPLSAYWDEWASGPKKQRLPPSLVTAGRESQVKNLILQLSSPPSVIGVQAGTREEALAFIGASLKQHEELIYDNTIIVDDKESLLEMMPTKLKAIVANLAEVKTLYHINPANQHILLPLAAADKFESEEIIRLPKLGREETVKALQDLGLDEDHARSISRKTARSLSVMRRVLGFDNHKPGWADDHNLLPALLVGKWADDREGDRQIIEYLSGQSYDVYTSNIRQWTLHHDAPITHIGTRWQLISPLDCWQHLGRFVSARQLKLFEESFLIACGDIKPALSLKPEERKYAGILGKTADFSHGIREGLTQTVILIATYGEANLVDVLPTPQIWADNLVGQLIATPDSDLWKSLDDIMPQLANASPSAVLSRLEHFIERQPGVLESVFENAPSLIHDNYYHTGLLWALEGMAWLPQYLLRASILFIRLKELDPGVKIMNRPVNSLHQVFQPIMPQTYASNTDRMNAIDTIIQRFPDHAWSLLLGLLSGNSMIGHLNEKLRWREFIEEPQEIYSDDKYNDYVSFISNRIFMMAGKNVKRVIVLLERFQDLWGSERSKLLELIEQNVSDLKDPDYQIWTSVRHILYESYNDHYLLSHLPAGVIQRFEVLYDAYKPEDITESNIWMFDDHWAKLPEKIRKRDDDWNGKAAYMEKRRKEALTVIYKNNSYGKFLSLAQRVKEPGIFGKIAALISLPMEQRARFAEMINSIYEKERIAASQFIRWYHIRKGIDAAKGLFRKISKHNPPSDTKAAFLLAMYTCFETWQFVATLDSDTQKAYWSKCEPDISDGDKDHLSYQLQKLFEAKRFISALYLAAHVKEYFETTVILTIMERLGSEKAEETMKLDSNHVTYLFKECYKRGNYDVQQMARLEWLYAEWLTGHYSPVLPKELFREMCENPELVAEFLSYAYPPDATASEDRDYEGMEKTQFLQRAKKAHSLLDALNSVPGQFVDSENLPALDGPYLKKWVKDLRQMSEDRSRLLRAESYIGKLIAKFPENPVCWPPDTIAEIIEENDSGRLRSNFSSTVTNKRSSTVRSPYAGGQIERNNARYFRKFEDCHRLSHPITAQIFSDIAARYDMRAKQEDDEALTNDMDY